MMQTFTVKMFRFLKSSGEKYDFSDWKENHGNFLIVDYQ